ncbi:DUF916 and DUF3324 domain-containing protein [Enterococcus pallens]|uniref:Uncharacterized protein n=1 Tax=Enterococcus pallens ATCC BAA-351 TaxID=1158607 RepID=R2T0D1_9ENTE|nr:DUF916 and DUF3324 domain-containing protein [Enterococcus pallens]EOH93739.1 hypothetical protein UAU_02435 [Enterococcus pallens ATCC BAA-351]EOU24579.1 hypothetical protein I588_00566 [Enterococcus pallens ATCC BAA-351]OJG79598.1 hypothetical protein RV10_GL000725 [Enterococcus pallens]
MNRLSKRNVKNLFIINCLLLSLILSMLFSAEMVHGDESETSQEPQIGKKQVPEPSNEQNKGMEVGFTVEAVKTDTQVDESKGFFFVKVLPGQEQQLTLKIKSTSEEERKVTIKIRDAFTNQNGEIDYDGAEYQRDESLKNSMEEITSVSEETVSVKNKEEKEIIITVKPPKESFDGVKVAAIVVMNAEDTEEQQKGLSSNYGYRLGLVITEEEEVDYSDGSSLNLLQVKPTVHQGKRVIQARLQNPEPKILDSLTVETKLRKKGDKEVLRKRTTNDMRMAPNSQFDFATNWGLDPIEAGTYVLSIKADSGENTWSWEEEFTIGEKEAKKINEEATYTITYPSWVPIVVLLIGTTTLANIGSLYVRRKKWTKEE